jgi:hypothetical protein
MKKKPIKKGCKRCSASNGDPRPSHCHYCGAYCDIMRPFARTFVLRMGGPTHGICRSCAE